MLRKLALLLRSGSRQAPLTIAWLVSYKKEAIQKQVNPEEYSLSFTLCRLAPIERTWCDECNI